MLSVVEERRNKKIRAALRTHGDVELNKAIRAIWNRRGLEGWSGRIADALREIYLLGADAGREE